MKLVKYLNDSNAFDSIKGQNSLFITYAWMIILFIILKFLLLTCDLKLLYLSSSFFYINLVIS